MASFKNLVLRQFEEVEGLLFDNPDFTIEAEDHTGLNILSPTKSHTRNLQSTLDKSGYSTRTVKLSNGSYRVRVVYRNYH